MAISAKGGDSSLVPVLSPSTSILTTAILSTHMSYDWDSSSTQRSKIPLFYRYLPRNFQDRFLSCALLFFFLSSNLVVRTLTFANFSKGEE